MSTFYVGIDWADARHDVHVTDDSTQPLASFSVPNSYQGFHSLVNRLRELSPNPEDFLIAIDAHHNLFISNLLEAGFTIYPINPKALDRYRDRYRSSKSKSDPKDAMVLAHILRTDCHLHHPLGKGSPLAQQLKILTRQHKSLVELKVKMVNQMTNSIPSSLRFNTPADVRFQRFTKSSRLPLLRLRSGRSPVSTSPHLGLTPGRTLVRTPQPGEENN